MKTISKLSVCFMILLCGGVVPLLAQGPPGGPGGFDPDEMIKREKQNIFKALPDLTEDQRLLMDGIFDEFALSFKEIREEMMQTRDFQAMRPKMEALRTERDGLVRDVLNDDQYNTYLTIIEERRKQRGNRPPGNSNFPPTPPENDSNVPTDKPQ